MKKFLIAWLIVGVAYFEARNSGLISTKRPSIFRGSEPPAAAPADPVVPQPVAPQQSPARVSGGQTSGSQIQGSGEVIRILDDDNSGSRHQKFIIKLASGQTLLVAHNIDIANRVQVSIGDQVGFSGQYESNPKGGVVHWTHHDPKGQHTAGWLSHNGRTYQ